MIESLPEQRKPRAQLRIAMIPARLGSKRVSKKSLRLLGNKPLVQWAVQAAVASQCFDEVWINSEARELETLAERLGVRFYLRSSCLAIDEATSDDFVEDFMRAAGGDVIAQILPTSPFITPNTIRAAVDLIDAGASTVLSIREVRTEALAYLRPVNYDPQRPMVPSQDLAPVQLFCNGVMAWRRDTFLHAKKYYGTAVYGPVGETKYVTLAGDEAIDIDTEEDWQTAELALARSVQPASKPRYWTPTLMQEWDALQIMCDDGVQHKYGFSDAGGSIADMLMRLPLGSSCCVRVVDTPGVIATVISQLPGEGNRLHYHPDCDEWWYILEGAYTFRIADKLRGAVKGDIVVVPRGVWHQIIAVGSKRAVRLAVSREGAAHVYHD